MHDPWTIAKVQDELPPVQVALGGTVYPGTMRGRTARAATVDVTMPLLRGRTCPATVTLA